jgi:hypothetical protein
MVRSSSLMAHYVNIWIQGILMAQEESVSAGSGNHCPSSGKNSSFSLLEVMSLSHVKCYIS